jgi:hypothetical protein
VAVKNINGIIIKAKVKLLINKANTPKISATKLVVGGALIFLTKTVAHIK